MSAQHTQGAKRLAEILLPEGIDRKGRASRLATACGPKTREGLADLIDNESGARELLDTLRDLADMLDSMTPEDFMNYRHHQAHHYAKHLVAKFEGRP